MQQRDILTELPNILSCIILQEWLNLKCVVATDSAYCSTILRKNFLKILDLEEYFVREDIVLPTSCDLSFLLKFGKKLRSVVLKKKFTSTQCSIIIENCKNLKNIQYYSQHCTYEIWNILPANPLLESLTVIGDGRNIPSFSKVKLSKLSAFRLSGWRVEDVQVAEALKMSSNILQLDLSWCRVLPTTLMGIGRLFPQLKSLGLGCMPMALTDGILGYIAAQCPCIVHLDIEDNLKISDEGILVVVQNLPGLQSLNIRYNYRLTDNTLEHLYTHCASTLHTLHICRQSRQPNNFSHTGIEQLLLHCTQLRNFSYATWIVPEERSVFNYSALRNLTTLSIESSYLTEPHLAAVAHHATNLQRLSTSQSGVTTATPNGNILLNKNLKHFVTGFPMLRELYLMKSYPSVCKTSLEALRAARPDVSVYVNVPHLHYDLLKMEI